MLAAGGAVCALAATLLAVHAAQAAAAQAWPAFALVTGLLLVGFVANGDGVFEAGAARLARIPGQGMAFFAGSMTLVAVVTALLNLDTAVVFLTPVLLYGARRRGQEEMPFLYGTVFMANASSLFLPGSNLTNLIVLADQPVSGSAFAARLIVPALTATLTTAVLLAVIFRRSLVTGGAPSGSPAPLPRVLGLAGTVAAGALLVALREPALPVLALGAGLVAARAARGGIAWRRLAEVVSPGTLAGLLGAAIALGALARTWDGPGDLVRSSGRLRTAALGAIAAVAVNNLPAAVLLSSAPLPHPRALLLGLNLGPNLAVTGSLAVFLWFQAARAAGAQPSAARYSRYGLLLAPAALLASLAAIELVGVTRV